MIRARTSSSNSAVAADANENHGMDDDASRGDECLSSTAFVPIRPPRDATRRDGRPRGARCTEGRRANDYDYDYDYEYDYAYEYVYDYDYDYDYDDYY